jgi:hypothetical protein
LEMCLGDEMARIIWHMIKEKVQCFSNEMIF